MHTIPSNKFHQAKFKPNSSFNTALQRRTTNNVSSQDVPLKAPTDLVKHQPCTKLYVFSESSCTRQKHHLHATHTFSSQGCLHVTFQVKRWNAQGICFFHHLGFWCNHHNKTDFHGTLKPCPYKHFKVKEVAQAIKVHGQGTGLWSVLDEAGMLQTSKGPTLYIPDA